MSLIDTWLQECDATDALDNPHFPSARSLLSTSQPTSITLGTGTSIFSRLSELILAKCEHELLFVTCFWAPSSSLTFVHDLLLALSAKAVAQNSKIRVRIGFSSLSLWQKLFHTTSPAGRVWSAKEWAPSLRLPAQELLPGLDVVVKSIFVLPLSVMHPKFVVIDREVAVLPSCNVSWENWFEGAVELRGPVVVDGFVRFFEGVWEYRDGEQRDPDGAVEPDLEAGSINNEPRSSSVSREPDRLATTRTVPASTLPSTTELSHQNIQTIFLPSHYHRNPHFHPLPWRLPPPPPPTPLNSFLLHLFTNATTTITIQTPNLTSPPVVAALLDALARGVSVSITTNERLMFIEQLVTAGTTTPSCVASLTTQHQQLKTQDHETQSLYRHADNASLGRLHIAYFSGEPGHGDVRDVVPVSSHLKMTVVDEEVVVLGSGNMDRASWYTSQELGVAFESREMAGIVLERVAGVNKRYCRTVYDG